MSGFPEYSGDDALSLTTARPNTPQVVDDHGRQTVYGTTDNADPSGNFPIDARIVEFIQYGVLNGSFARSPADQNHDITDINPLPDWTGPVSVSGGAITAQWVADSGSPSGYNLRFTVNPGAASDEAYFQQIVPILGDRKQLMGHVLRATATYSAPSAVTGKIAVQYLDVTGATVGSEYTNTQSSNTGTHVLTMTSLLTSAVAPATAESLRIRIGVVRGGSASDAETVDFSSVRMDRAQSALIVADLYDGGGYFPGYTKQTQGISSVGVGYASGLRYYFVDANNQYIDLNDYGGIKFPATQVPITDVNTLDDYEEGTFTPALAFATPSTSSWAVTTQVGFYTKIGNRVQFHFFYQGVPSTYGAASGNLQLTGLPFTVQNTASSGARFGLEFQGYTKANFTQITGFCNINTTIATFRASGSGQTTAALQVGDIPTGGTVIVAGGGHYFV